MGAIMLIFGGRETQGLFVLTFEEASDAETPATSAWLFKTIDARDDPRFAVDLGDVRFMSSSDFGVLLAAKRRVDARGGKIVLFNVPPSILDMLRTMRIDRLFTFAPDLDAALAALAA